MGEKGDVTGAGVGQVVSGATSQAPSPTGTGGTAGVHASADQPSSATAKHVDRHDEVNDDLLHAALGLQTGSILRASGLYSGISTTNFLSELWDDFASGDAYDRLGEFFYHVPQGFKGAAVSLWNSLGVAWNGWGPILRNPELLIDLPDDIKASFQGILAVIKDLSDAAVEKDGGKRFAALVGDLTGNVMFQATLARAAAYSKSTVVSKVVPKPVEGALGAVTPPKPTPPTISRHIPGSNVQGLPSANQILAGGKFAPPIGSAGTFLQGHMWACGVAQIRTILRDLGLPMQTEEAILRMAEEGKFLQAGGINPKNLTTLLNEVGKGKLSAVLAPVRSMGGLTEILNKFPQWKIITGVTNAAGGGHWVRLQELTKSLAIIGDSATGQSIVTAAEMYERARHWGATILVRSVP